VTRDAKGPIRSVFGPNGEQPEEGAGEPVRVHALSQGTAAAVVALALLGIGLFGLPGSGNHRERDLSSLQHTSTRCALAFSPDGATLAVVTDDGLVSLWDPAARRRCGELRPTPSHGKAQCDVSYSPDDGTLAASDPSRKVTIWSPGDGGTRATLEPDLGQVRMLAFSPDGKTLAAACDEGVPLWDAASGRIHETLPVSPSRPASPFELAMSLTFGPSGRTLAVGDSTGDITVWDRVTHRALSTLRRHVGPVIALTYSPDGRVLASGGGDSDRTVRLWDVASGRVIHTLTGHTGPVLDVRFAPDGATLATASADGTARLWDAATGRQRAVLQRHPLPLTAVAYSPDGATLVTGSADGRIAFWPSPVR
jgi:WD40 repeat protein